MPRIKCNFQNSSKIITVDPSSLLFDVLSQIRLEFLSSELDLLVDTGLVQIQYDYPKKTLEVVENLSVSMETLGFVKNTQIWLVDPTSQSGSVNEGGPVAKPSANGPKYVEECASGYCVFRQMEDDNSCLFHAVSYCLFQTANEVQSLREVAAKTILGNKIRYTEAYLGKKPQDYVDWIQQKKLWGGAIELEIFAEHFEVSIYSIDVLSGRVDQFNPDAQTFVVIFYSGVHFDALAYNPVQTALMLERKEGDITVFYKESSIGREVLESAEKLANTMRALGYATDMAKIVTRCEQCGGVFEGEKSLLQHMKLSGHTEFTEVK